MKRSILAFITVALLLVAALSLLTAGGALADEQLSPEALSIANSLNCPVCEGLSVRDSQSQLSGQMRQEIQKRLDEGQTRQQIIDYFVSRYGVGILRSPPKHGFTQTLWWGPVVGLVVGLVILGTFLGRRLVRSDFGRSRATSEGAAASTDDDELSAYEERMRQELEGLDMAD